MTRSFKIGDIVQLKSGGPKMTVEAIEDRESMADWEIRGGVKVAWFAGAKRESSIFHPDTLVHIDDQTK